MGGGGGVWGSFYLVGLGWAKGDRGHKERSTPPDKGGVRGAFPALLWPFTSLTIILPENVYRQVTAGDFRDNWEQ